MVSLVEIASAKALNVVAAYSDWGVSGRGDKPGFTALMEAAQRGEFDVVVVRDISDLGRDAALVMRRLQALRTANVRIWTLARGEIDDLMAFSLAVSQSAAKDRGRRIAEGMKLAAERRLAARLQAEEGKH